MATALINGRTYTHKDIVFNVLGVPLVSLSTLSIKSSQIKEFHYGTGEYPVGLGIGRKEPIEVTFELSLNDIDALEDSAPNNDIKDIPAFDIPITVVHPTKSYLLTVKNFVFTEDTKDTDTDTTDIKVSCTGTASNLIKQ